MKKNDLILGILVMIVWGLNFSVIKLGVNEIDPLLLTALRFTLATLPAIFFVKKPEVSWYYLIIYGWLFAIGIWGMATWSIQAGLSAGMASVLLQMNVVFGLFLGYFLLKEPLPLNKVIGSGIALAGLLLSLTVTDGSVTQLGLMLILFAAISWSLASITIKKAGTKQVFAFSLWAMAFAPIPLFLIVYLQSGSDAFIQLSTQLNERVIFSVLFQAYPVTLLGYWIWNRLLVSYPLTTVAPLTLLVPIFGLLGGVLFYQEEVGMIKFIASVCVISGILIGFINLKKRKTA
ncbi:EamA family transporter [uncultured Psychromonas sp.]|uniref:EamA family transporter n=1 Tax=uncultured Psychromonas sp. TaxID=173974 RepID=UPI0026271A56|nr:EamA family transporter [uncultured Psychromonas sp.]